MTYKDKDIKPCPFCGSKAYLKEDEDHHGKFHYLGCSNPKCICHTLFYTIDTEEQPVKRTIELWNKRVKNPQKEEKEL